MATKHRITARERANRAAQGVLEVWESGKLPGLIAESVLKQQGNVPCSRWSLNNVLMMLVQGTSDARGFKQWKEVGRNVRKGAKAIYIWGPRTVKRTIERDGREVEEACCIGFRSIPVFRFEDTEGEPLEVSDYTPDTLPPLQEVADSIGLRVSYSPALANAAGRYLPDAKAIELYSHDTPTWFHELSHAVDDYLGTMKRDKRKQGRDPRHGAAYKDGEVVAEFCAASLCHLYGIPYESNALKYIKHYRDDAAKSVHRLMARIEGVLSFILETREVAGDESGDVAGDAREVADAKQAA